MRSHPLSALFIVVVAGCTGKVIEPAPTARYNAMGQLDASGEVFHLVGGADSSGMLQDAWALDIPHRQWVRVDGPSVPLLSAAAARVDDIIHVFGGTTTGRVETDGLVGWETRGGIWEDLDAGADRPTARREATLTALGDEQAVLIGGNNDDSGDPGATFGDVWGLDVRGPTWTEVPTTDGPAGLQRHATAFDGARVWVHGGIDASGILTASLWSLDVATWIWTEHTWSTDGPEARADHLLAYADGRLVVWGGQLDDPDVWVFDVASSAWDRVAADGPSERDAFAWDVVDDAPFAVVVGGDPVDSEGYASDVWVLDLQTIAWTEILRLDDTSF